MTVIIYDRRGVEYKVSCEKWEHSKEKERYIFYDDRQQIVAVFQADAIVGFTVER